MTKNFIPLFAVVVLYALPTLAQERQVGVGVAYTPPSTGTGDGASVGIRGEAVLPLTSFLRAVAEANWAIEEKLYIADGSGSAFRARAELRAQLPAGGVGSGIFVGVGGSMVRRSTSQYVKTAFNPTISLGINIKNRVIPQVKWFLEEKQTGNRARALQIGGDAYLPLDRTDWRIRVGMWGVRSAFFQPFGDRAGENASWTFQMTAGVSRVF